MTCTMYQFVVAANQFVIEINGLLLRLKRSTYDEI